jgi:hydrogenase maturation factor
MENKDVGSEGYALTSVKFQDKVANNVENDCFNTVTIITRFLTHITG